MYGIYCAARWACWLFANDARIQAGAVPWHQIPTAQECAEADLESEEARFLIAQADLDENAAAEIRQ